MSGALRFDIEVRGINRLDRRMDAAAQRAEHAVAIQIARDTEKFVPASTNKSLSNRTRVDGNTVIYPGPYAHYLYVGKLYVDPNTGSPFSRYGTTKVITGRDLQYNRTVHSRAQSHWYEASKAVNAEKWNRVAGRVIRSEFPG